jgi:hypothetical protein
VSATLVIGRRSGPEEGVVMTAAETQPTKTTTGSQARRQTVAVISAWACLGVVAIVAALILLF